MLHYVFISREIRELRIIITQVIAGIAIIHNNNKYLKTH